MSDTTPTLSLPYLMPAQAQKHVTHNEALQLLDALVQLRVQAFDVQTPPLEPPVGASYALGESPTGAWAGQATHLAIWQGEGWLFIAPQIGWRAWGETPAELRIWQGSNWELPGCDTQNLAQLGVNTTADASNPLSVSGPATLLTHAGNDHRLKLNKASGSDTAALLFQSNWSGRAEMGLLGNNDFAIKVSSDGSSWAEALRIDRNTGDIGLGTANPEHRLDVRGQGWFGGSPIGTTATLGARVDDANTGALLLAAHDGSYSNCTATVNVTRAASPAYKFLQCYSNNFADLEFRLSGDGNGSCDGSWTGGGADYAEWFEWADGNPDHEDRRGRAVLLAGNKIRLAKAGEIPFGAISANPSVVGDGDIDRWKEKYLRDAFGSYLWEAHETGRETDGEAGQETPGKETGKETGGQIQQRRRLNPAYDPERPYVPRAKRPEWAMVGMMGKLRLRKGQPTDPRWIRMRQVSAEIEEWLLR